MKKILIVLVSAALLCTVAASIVVTSAMGESSFGEQTENISEASAESSAESSVESTSESVAEETFEQLDITEELALLDAFFDAWLTVEKQETVEQAENTSQAQFGEVFYRECSGYERKDPMFVGVFGEYVLFENVLETTAHDCQVLPEGVHLDYSVYPAFASQCGAYLVGNGEVIKLEDAIGTIVEQDDVYGLLSERCRERLDLILQK